MEHLSTRELYKLAPGARPRKNAKKERLLDTSVWIAHLARWDWVPVCAMQGTSHEDAGLDPADGRHLVVCAGHDGHAVALLNSHDRLMRVWMGAGVWRQGELLLAHTEPLKRTVEIAPALELLSEHIPAMPIASSSSKAQANLTRRIVETGYIKGRGRPDVNAVLGALVGHPKMDDVAHAAMVVGVLRAGNLAPDSPGRRNVKGIRRPDSYWHLAQAAWSALR